MEACKLELIGMRDSCYRLAFLCMVAADQHKLKLSEGHHLGQGYFDLDLIVSKH